jgi:integrase
MPVYKQPNSTNWLIEFIIDGTRYRRSSKTHLKRKAEQQEQKWRQQIYDGIHQVSKREPMMMEQAIERYWQSVIVPKQSRKKSKRAEHYVLETIKHRFGPTYRLDRIIAADIAKWRDDMINQGKEPATVNRYLASLRAILNRACSDWNTIPSVPSIRLLSLNNTRQHYLNEDQERRILKVAAPHLRNLIIFLIDTGTRLSEATELTWSDVSLADNGRSFVTLTRTKSGKPRRIPLTQRAERLLSRIRIENEAELENVFTYRSSKAKQPVPFSNPFRSWKTALKNAGIDPKLRIHDLRHTFASRLVSKGIPLYDVSKLLGHSSIAMTTRYAHLAPEAFEAAISSLETSIPDDHDDVGNVADFTNERYRSTI